MSQELLDWFFKDEPTAKIALTALIATQIIAKRGIPPSMTEDTLAHLAKTAIWEKKSLMSRGLFTTVVQYLYLLRRTM